MLEQSQAGNLPTITVVPMANAWVWLVKGYQLFKENPVMWMILFVLYCMIMLPISLIPIIGSLISTLLAPVFLAGMMLGCRALQKQQDLEINHLFLGFKKHTAQLISVGGLYMLGVLIIAVFLVLSLDKATLELIEKGHKISPEQAANLMGPLLIASLLFVPVMMAYWFAPVLVALNEVRPLVALKLSFVACLKNGLPFLAYGLIFMLLFVAYFLLMLNFAQIGAVLIMLSLLVVIPIMMTSLYMSYVDIFREL